MRKTLFVLLGILILGALAQEACAQMSSPNYRIPRQAFSNSGGAMSSPTRRQPVTIAAQSTPIGIATSPGYRNFAGYLYGGCIAAKGDMNASGTWTPADLGIMLNCVYITGYPGCDLCFADVNCTGSLTPADVAYQLNRIYLSSPYPCI